MTNELIKKKPKNLFVVEKDNNLSKFLHKRFGNQIKIVNKDILTCYKNFNYEMPIKVFGNLPYNISTKILGLLWTPTILPLPVTEPDPIVFSSGSFVSRSIDISL